MRLKFKAYLHPIKNWRWILAVHWYEPRGYCWADLVNWVLDKEEVIEDVGGKVPGHCGYCGRCKDEG